MTTVEVTVGGQVPLPAELRQAAGIGVPSQVVIEPVAGGLLIRPLPTDVEVYTPERKAEFLLTGAVDEAEYAEAVQAVRAMGLDPDRIPHRRPVAGG